MIRKHVFLSDEQVDFLKKNTELRLTDHIRRAMDDYMDKLMNRYATTSQSKIKNKDGK